MSLTLLFATHASIRTSDTSSIPHRTPSQAYGTLRYRFRHSYQMTNDAIDPAIMTARRPPSPPRQRTTCHPDVSPAHECTATLKTKSNASLHRLSSDNCYLKPSASAGGLSPGTSSAQDGLTRPVSCYAFFKGWLLLSQPAGCFGNPTCFPT